MSQAIRDVNSVATLIGVSNVDYSTPITVAVDPVTHRVLTNATTGTWYQDEIVGKNTTGTSFNLLNNPSSVVMLYKNGQYLVSGAGYDYTRSGQAITLAVSLMSSDLLTATYS
jgi:hypothetical protein